MKNCSQKNRHLVGIKALHYCRFSSPKPWEIRLQEKYGIAPDLCSKKHKNGECWLYAKNEIVFDKHGYVCKSNRTLFNTQLQTEFNYRNVYDVHCRLVQWNVTIEQNEVTLQFPQCHLIQPANMVFSYNEYGDLASASDGKVESAFEYKYDVNGNWTTRYQMVNGKCVEIIVRQLIYSEAEETVAESDLSNGETDELELQVATEEYEIEDYNEDECKEVIEDEESTEDTKDNHSDPSAGIIGKQVSHGKFGIGKIVSFDDKEDRQYISVEFASGIKKFVYPSAFDCSFLKWMKE